MNKNTPPDERLLARDLLQIAKKAIRVLERAYATATAKGRRSRKAELLCDSCGAPRVRKR